MSTTVVVDGGGSGCRLAAFDASGARLHEVQSGPASLTLGVEQAWQNIKSGLEQLVHHCDVSFDTTCSDQQWPEILVMGLAGTLHEDRRARFCALIPPQINYQLISDGHAQLLGATGNQPGVCAAIGTGSVVHWCTQDGSFEMVGGWGFPATDEASGAWLGMHAVKLFTVYLDRQRTQRLLPDAIQYTDALMSELEQILGSTVSDVQTWSTCTDATQLATLAPYVVNAAAQGSTQANKLLQRGARELEAMISLAPEHLPLYLVGGLAHVYQPLLQPSYSARVATPVGSVFDGLYACAAQLRCNSG